MRRTGRTVAVILALAGLLAVVGLGARRAHRGNVPGGSGTVASKPPALPWTATALLTAPLPSSHATTPPRPKAAAVADAKPVSLRPESVVARVNGVAITGADLVPFSKQGKPERTLSAEMYLYLRERAVERELTVQAAKAGGVTLDKQDKAQLDGLRKLAAQRGVTDPAEVDHEVRDAEGRLLADALLAQKGGPPPFPGTADVDRYYDEHQADFDPLPDDPQARTAARAQIDLRIRQLLNGQLRAAHDQGLRDLLETLRKSATISES